MRLQAFRFQHDIWPAFAENAAMSQTPSVKPEEITFSREQFYEKIWSAPATQLAKEIGLSDVMIGKIC